MKIANEKEKAWNEGCLVKHMEFKPYEEYEGETKEIWLHEKDEKVGIIESFVTLYEEHGKRKIKTRIIDTGSIHTGNVGEGNSNFRPYLIEVPVNWNK